MPVISLSFILNDFPVSFLLYQSHKWGVGGIKLISVQSLPIFGRQVPTVHPRSYTDSIFLPISVFLIRNFSTWNLGPFDVKAYPNFSSVMLFSNILAISASTRWPPLAIYHMNTIICTMLTYYMYMWTQQYMYMYVTTKCNMHPHKSINMNIHNYTCNSQWSSMVVQTYSI